MALISAYLFLDLNSIFYQNYHLIPFKVKAQDLYKKLRKVAKHSTISAKKSRVMFLHWDLTRNFEFIALNLQLFSFNWKFKRYREKRVQKFKSSKVIELKEPRNTRDTCPARILQKPQKCPFCFQKLPLRLNGKVWPLNYPLLKFEVLPTSLSSKISFVSSSFF